MSKRHFNTKTVEYVLDKIDKTSGGIYKPLDLERDYVNTSSKISTLCTKHNIIWNPTIEKLYKGSGCSECAKEKQKLKLQVTPEKKIREICAIHGENKFDFSKVPDDGVITEKYEIKCNRHGEWFQKSLVNLLKGKGCNKCAYESRMKSYDKRKELKLEDKPFYILEESWKSNKHKSSDFTTKYPLKCKNCDYEFEATWDSLNSCQDVCPCCANGRVSNLEDFKAKVAYHRSDEKPSYNLSMFEYTGYDQPSKVLCEKHGFCQIMSARSLVDGRVLHCCWLDEHHGGWNISRLNDDLKNKMGVLYHLRFTNKEGKVFDKVGITTKTIAARFWAVGKLGYTYEIIRVCEDTVYNCVLLEHIIKESLKEDDRLYRIHDFKHKSIGGWTECFYPITTDTKETL